jgi:hypothetical protein
LTAVSPPTVRYETGRVETVAGVPLGSDVTREPEASSVSYAPTPTNGKRLR